MFGAGKPLITGDGENANQVHKRRDPEGLLARVAASLRGAGRKPSARSFDAMIAAIAIANGLPLYTANPADFAGIDDLVVRPIPAPRT